MDWIYAELSESPAAPVSDTDTGCCEHLVLTPETGPVEMRALWECVLGCRWTVSQGTMRPLLIVLSPPPLYEYLGFGKGVEHFTV